jgi:hypothetical protein
MSGCEQRQRCRFYCELSEKLGMVVFFITDYCHGPGYQFCARYRMEKEGGSPPADLYPNQLWRLSSLRGGAAPPAPIEVAARAKARAAVSAP